MKDQLSKKKFRDFLYSANIHEFNIALQAMFSRAHHPCLMAFIGYLRYDEEDLFAEYAQNIPQRYYEEIYHSYLCENSILIQNFSRYLMYVCEGKIAIIENEQTDELFMSIIKTLEYVCKPHEHSKGMIAIAETLKRYKPAVCTVLLDIIRKMYFVYKLIIFNKKFYPNEL